MTERFFPLELLGAWLDGRVSWGMLHELKAKLLNVV
jgi:hypothetical protein